MCNPHCDSSWLVLFPSVEMRSYFISAEMWWRFKIQCRDLTTTSGAFGRQNYWWSHQPRWHAVLRSYLILLWHILATQWTRVGMKSSWIKKPAQPMIVLTVPTSPLHWEIQWASSTMIAMILPATSFAVNHFWNSGCLRHISGKVKTAPCWFSWRVWCTSIRQENAEHVTFLLPSQELMTCVTIDCMWWDSHFFEALSLTWESSCRIENKTKCAYMVSLEYLQGW